LIRRVCRRGGVPSMRPRMRWPSPHRRGCCAAGRARGVTEFSRAARDAAAAHCRHCGASLRWGVPGLPADPMGRRAEVRPASSRSSFRDPLIRYFEAAQHAHKIRDYAAALAYLQKVQQFAPHHVGARKGVEKVKEEAGRDRPGEGDIPGRAIEASSRLRPAPPSRLGDGWSIRRRPS